VKQRPPPPVFRGPRENLAFGRTRSRWPHRRTSPKDGKHDLPSPTTRPDIRLLLATGSGGSEIVGRLRVRPSMAPTRSPPNYKTTTGVDLAGGPQGLPTTLGLLAGAAGDGGDVRWGGRDLARRSGPTAWSPGTSNKDARPNLGPSATRRGRGKVHPPSALGHRQRRVAGPVSSRADYDPVLAAPGRLNGDGRAGLARAGGPKDKANSVRPSCWATDLNWHFPSPPHSSQTGCRPRDSWATGRTSIRTNKPGPGGSQTLSATTITRSFNRQGRPGRFNPRREHRRQFLPRPGRPTPPPVGHQPTTGDGPGAVACRSERNHRAIRGGGQTILRGHGDGGPSTRDLSSTAHNQAHWGPGRPPTSTGDARPRPGRRPLLQPDDVELWLLKQPGRPPTEPGSVTGTGLKRRSNSSGVARTQARGSGAEPGGRSTSTPTTTAVEGTGGGKPPGTTTASGDILVPGPGPPGRRNSARCSGAGEPASAPAAGFPGRGRFPRAGPSGGQDSANATTTFLPIDPSHFPVKFQVRPQT